MSDKKRDVINQQNERLIYMTYLQREQDRYHHTYDEELLQYEYLKNGDMRSIEEAKRMFQSGVAGTLSKDPVRDKKYLFCCSITLATRFAIEGGLKAEEAYNLSDLYIQQMDTLTTVQEIYDLQLIMFTDFTERVALARKTASHENCAPSLLRAPEISHTDLTRPVAESMDYIYYHLHEKITIASIADYVKMTPNHLATVFKKETGHTIQEYIRSTRLSTAKNMLLYSDYSITEISQLLAFASASHFVKLFREEYGETPKAFRNANYRHHWKGEKKPEVLL